MQLASHGLRRVPNLLSHKLGGWIASGAPVRASLRTAGHASTPFSQQLVNSSKNVLTQIFSHLTAPGLAEPHLLHAAHSVRAGGARSIQSSLSLPARHALGRPLGAPVLPRAPTVPRGVTQVGLGTARNFHAARPIFANLVENVPVAGRALWEADWQMRVQEERRGVKKASKNKEQKRQGLKLKENRIPIVIEETKAKDEVSEELNRYFPESTLASVATYLMVPLTPTPTSRVPLQPSIGDEPRLPMAAAAELHSSHYMHSTRVQSLFTRLDAADVWSRGAVCEPMGTNGECTVLAVKLEGWTEKEVRGVIGEAGTGWCALEEVRRDNVADSLCSTPAGEEDPLYASGAVDPAASLVLPTLDFSSTFMNVAAPSVDASPALSRASSSLSQCDVDCGSSAVDLAMPDGGEEIGSDFESDDSSWGSFSRPPSSLNSAPSTRVTFSSAFSERIVTPSDEWEPREYMF